MKWPKKAIWPTTTYSLAEANPFLNSGYLVERIEKIFLAAGDVITLDGRPRIFLKKRAYTVANYRENTKNSKNRGVHLQRVIRKFPKRIRILTGKIKTKKLTTQACRMQFFTLITQV